jgi:hypothetical protein
MALRMTPWRRPGAFLAIWSHKLLRWATPWLALGALLSAARLTLDGRRSYALPLAAGLGTVVVALVGLVAERGGRPIRAAAFPATMLTVNVAFVAGWVNLVRRRTIASWDHPEPPTASGPRS